MKHRHPSKDGEGSGGFNPDANVDPRTGEQLSASGGSPVYRGVPFWERNKNPKIAQGYKEGYKYRHRKQKPLTAAELKKIEEKRNREQQKLERKQNKENPEDTGTEETPSQETQTEETPNGDPQTEAVQADGEPAEETKAEKRQRRRESKKKKKEQPAEPETQPTEQAPPKRQPPPKPAEDEKKDGF